MTKVNANNENEIKQDISPWDIYESDTTSSLIKSNKVFQ